MTIKDLAALSGYAVGTVSRVLNHQPNVSEKARTTILALAESHGFELNTNAKNLKQRSSNGILVVVRGVHNELFAALVEQMQVLAAAGEYRLVVDYVDELGHEVRRARQLVRELKPQGILFLGGNSAHFAECFEGIEVPAVLVTNSAEGLGFSRLSSVTTDDKAAAAEAIERLAQAGHREFAIIGGDLDNSDTSRLRYAGCMESFDKHAIAFDEARRFRRARYSYDDGYRAMAQILRTETAVTAVFAMSDTMAIGAARAIRDAGKRIPEDISLVGFDGLPICGYYSPRLATVIQQTAFMAETSFSILKESIEEGAPARHVSVPYEFAENGSLRALSKDR